MLEWERLPKEAAKTYAKFCYYRDLGVERTYAKVAKKFDVSPVTVQELASKHRWRSRAEAYDAHLEREKRKAEEEIRLKMVQRHADMANAFSRIAFFAPQALLNRLKEKPDEVKRLEDLDIEKLLRMSNEAVRTFQIAMNAERLARGIPTEIKETTNTHAIQNIDAFVSDNNAQKLAHDLLRLLSRPDGEQGDNG